MRQQCYIETKCATKQDVQETYYTGTPEKENWLNGTIKPNQGNIMDCFKKYLVDTDSTGYSRS